MDKNEMDKQIKIKILWNLLGVKILMKLSKKMQ